MTPHPSFHPWQSAQHESVTDSVTPAPVTSPPPEAAHAAEALVYPVDGVAEQYARFAQGRLDYGQTSLLSAPQPSHSDTTLTPAPDATPSVFSGQKSPQEWSVLENSLRDIPPHLRPYSPQNPSFRSHATPQPAEDAYPVSLYEETDAPDYASEYLSPEYKAHMARTLGYGTAAVREVESRYSEAPVRRDTRQEVQLPESRRSGAPEAPARGRGNRGRLQEIQEPFEDDALTEDVMASSLPIRPSRPGNKRRNTARTQASPTRQRDMETAPGPDDFRSKADWKYEQEEPQPLNRWEEDWQEPTSGASALPSRYEAYADDMLDEDEEDEVFEPSPAPISRGGRQSLYEASLSRVSRNQPELSHLSPPAMEQLSRQLVDAVLEQVAQQVEEEDFLERYVDTVELKKDNQILAAQVRRLLQEKKLLEQDRTKAENDLQQFKRIFGNIYLKIDG